MFKSLATQLKSLRKCTSVPFEFTLLTPQDPMMVEHILRVMPKKRVVLQGQWRQQAVVVKCFFGRRAKHHYQAELHGLDALKQAKIATPLYFTKETLQIILAIF